MRCWLYDSLQGVSNACYTGVGQADWLGGWACLLAGHWCTCTPLFCSASLCWLGLHGLHVAALTSFIPLTLHPADGARRASDRSPHVARASQQPETPLLAVAMAAASVKAEAS